mgnify:CR=1 FL=1
MLSVLTNALKRSSNRDHSTRAQLFINHLELLMPPLHVLIKIVLIFLIVASDIFGILKKNLTKYCLYNKHKTARNM